MDTCSICHRTIPEGPVEVWRTDEGESISVPTSSEPSAILETPSGELQICEHCYHGGLPASISQAQRCDLHYQFAIEYCHCDRFAEALHACERALEFGESADTLAHMGYIHSKMEHPVEEESFYRRALVLDPDHFIATHNLNLLLQTHKQEGTTSQPNDAAAD